MRSDESLMLLAAALLAPLLATACGGFEESNGHVARVTIGDAGGALHLESFSIEVPARSLAHTVTLSATRAALDAPDGHAYILEPSDAVFAMPATVSITYDAGLFPHPSEVLVATYTGTAWHSLAAAGTPESGVAHATTSHTGTFGIVHCPGNVCPTVGADAGADH